MHALTLFAKYVLLVIIYDMKTDFLNGHSV